MKLPPRQKEALLRAHRCRGPVTAHPAIRTALADRGLAVAGHERLVLTTPGVMLAMEYD